MQTPEIKIPEAGLSFKTKRIIMPFNDSCQVLVLSGRRSFKYAVEAVYNGW
jgi:hypothetical protein